MLCNSWQSILTHQAEIQDESIYRKNIMNIMEFYDTHMYVVI